MTVTTSKVFAGFIAFAVAFTLASCGGTSNSTTGQSSNVTVSLNQSSMNVAVGATAQFTATVQNTTNTAVSWSVDGVAGGNATTGTISASGLYTAPAAAGSHKVTATSVADTNASASAAVTVGALGAISPATAFLPPGGTQQFSSSIQGFSNTSVNWAVNQVAGGNASVGTITAAGLYTAPSQPGTYTVTATSAADSSVTASATVTVGTITLSPTSATLASSQIAAVHAHRFRRGHDVHLVCGWNGRRQRDGWHHLSQRSLHGAGASGQPHGDCGRWVDNRKRDA